MEPSNPSAVFPQIAKPDIMDFRSHKMERGGYAATNTFRKHLSDKTIKSPYVSIVKTAEDLAAEAEEAAQKMDSDFEDVEEEKVVQKSKKTTYTVDDIVGGMDKSLKISKNKKNKKSEDVTMAAASSDSKTIKKNDKYKKKHARKSQKIVKF